jgi:hypothetical protein
VVELDETLMLDDEETLTELEVPSCATLRCWQRTEVIRTPGLDSRSVTQSGSAEASCGSGEDGAGVASGVAGCSGVEDG